MIVLLRIMYCFHALRYLAKFGGMLLALRGIESTLEP